MACPTRQKATVHTPTSSESVSPHDPTMNKDVLLKFPSGNATDMFDKGLAEPTISFSASKNRARPQRTRNRSTDEAPRTERTAGASSEYFTEDNIDWDARSGLHYIPSPVSTPTMYTPTVYTPSLQPKRCYYNAWRATPHNNEDDEQTKAGEMKLKDSHVKVVDKATQPSSLEGQMSDAESSSAVISVEMNNTIQDTKEDILRREYQPLQERVKAAAGEVRHKLENTDVQNKLGLMGTMGSGVDSSGRVSPIAQVEGESYGYNYIQPGLRYNQSGLDFGMTGYSLPPPRRTMLNDSHWKSVTTEKKRDRISTQFMGFRGSTPEAITSCADRSGSWDRGSSTATSSPALGKNGPWLSAAQRASVQVNAKSYGTVPKNESGDKPSEVDSPTLKQTSKISTRSSPEAMQSFLDAQFSTFKSAQDMPEPKSNELNSRALWGRPSVSNASSNGCAFSKPWKKSMDPRNSPKLIHSTRANSPGLSARLNSMCEQTENRQQTMQDPSSQDLIDFNTRDDSPMNGTASQKQAATDAKGKNKVDVSTLLGSCQGCLPGCNTCCPTKQHEKRLEGGNAIPKWSCLHCGSLRCEGCDKPFEGEGSTDQENGDGGADVSTTTAGGVPVAAHRQEAPVQRTTTIESLDILKAVRKLRQQAPFPEEAKITYRVTVRCGEHTVDIPIDGNNVSGPEKVIINSGMKKVWKWVQDKKLEDKVSLQDAYDLAKEMDEDAAKETKEVEEVKEVNGIGAGGWNIPRAFPGGQFQQPRNPFDYSRSASSMSTDRFNVDNGAWGNDGPEGWF